MQPLCIREIIPKTHIYRFIGIKAKNISLDCMEHKVIWRGHRLNSTAPFAIQAQGPYGRADIFTCSGLPGPEGIWKHYIIIWQHHGAYVSQYKKCANSKTIVNEMLSAAGLNTEINNTAEAAVSVLARPQCKHSEEE